MKRLLGLILSLYGLNLEAQSFNWYTGLVSIDSSKKSTLLSALSTNSARDFNNVAIIEYLLEKHVGWSYNALINETIGDKKGFTESFLTLPSVPVVSAASGASGVLEKYINLVAINANDLEIWNNLNTNKDLNNLAVVEYLLGALFGYKNWFLDDLLFSDKLDLLKQRLLPSSVSLTPLVREAVVGSTFKAVEPAAASGPGNYDDSAVPRYKQMIKSRRPNVEILANLMAPKVVKITVNSVTDQPEVDLSDWDTRKTLEEVVPLDSVQDINNMAVVDYLLETKFYQPRETINKMYPYFKIVDLKRQLLPYDQRTLRMDIPWAASREAANFPNQSVVKPRDQKFYRSWIEFPSSSRLRHLDYNKGDGKTVYLMDSANFIYRMNDYKVVNSYAPYGEGARTTTKPIVNYYWAKDGDSFLLVFDDGSSQRYGWERGEPVGEPIAPSTEVIDISDDSEEDDSTSASDEDAAATAKRPSKIEQMPGETDLHFRVRRRALLNTTGKVKEVSKDSDAVMAMSVQALDTNTFTDLSDKMINELRDPEDFDLVKINQILAQNPDSVSTFDRAKIYVLINTGMIDRLDPSRIALWKAALDEMELASASAIDVGVSSKIRLSKPIIFDSNAYGQALSKFALDGVQQGLLAKPATYLRHIGSLLKQSPASADQFTAAKVFMALASGWIDPSEDKNPNVIKWRDYLNI